MLTDKRFDFSQESDLKEKLWEQMLKKNKETAPKREEVKFESLIEQPKSFSADKKDVVPEEPGKVRKGLK